MPLISFIVPVYNAEKYLHRCLKSIVHQLNGSELILVDDGSADLSGKICDEYAAEYSGIRVIHTENRGPSHARNLGVDSARGSYIVFVDSDDYINDDFVVQFERSGIAADVVFYPIEKLLANGELIPMGDGLCVEGIRNRTASEVLEYISSCPKFPASPCGKLIRRSFLEKHRIHFAFHRITEDYDWTYQLLQYAQSYDFFAGGQYVYRQVPQSRSAERTAKSVEDQLAILTCWEKKDVDGEYRRFLNAFLAYEYAMILLCYGALSPKEKKLYSREMRRCSYLLRYGKSRKLKLIRSVCSVWGVGLTSAMLHQYICRRSIRYGK